jgi:hypothetical protein
MIGTQGKLVEFCRGSMAIPSFPVLLLACHYAGGMKQGGMGRKKEERIGG